MSFVSQLLKNTPLSVVVEILSKWLSVDDVCRLDSATSNTLDRQIMSSRLCPIVTSYESDAIVKKHFKEFIVWVKKYNICIKTLALYCHAPTESVTLTDILMKGFGKQCRFLVKLELVNCNHISDAIFIELITNSPPLRELRLEDCHQLTDRTFTALAQHKGLILSNLNQLCLSGCPRLTDDSLRALQQTGVHRLIALSITDCHFTTQSILPVLTTSRATLNKFECIRCVKAASVVAILCHFIGQQNDINDTVGGATDLSRPILSQFTLQHSDSLPMREMTSYTHVWMPHIKQLKTTGKVRMKVCDGTATVTSPSGVTNSLTKFTTEASDSVHNDRMYIRIEYSMCSETELAEKKETELARAVSEALVPTINFGWDDAKDA